MTWLHFSLLFDFDYFVRALRSAVQAESSAAQPDKANDCGPAEVL